MGSRQAAGSAVLPVPTREDLTRCAARALFRIGIRTCVRCPESRWRWSPRPAPPSAQDSQVQDAALLPISLRPLTLSSSERRESVEPSMDVPVVPQNFQDIWWAVCTHHSMLGNILSLSPTAPHDGLPRLAQILHQQVLSNIKERGSIRRIA
jgi:hypothetical protein